MFPARKNSVYTKKDKGLAFQRFGSISYDEYGNVKA